MKKKYKEILENNFRIHEEELETHTNGGVNMFIHFDKDKDIVEELERYIDNFDIDEEIDLYRQCEDYCRAFTISASIRDFEDYIQWLKGIVNKLKGIEKTLHLVDLNKDDLLCLIRNYDNYINQKGEIGVDKYFNTIYQEEGK